MMVLVQAVLSKILAFTRACAPVAGARSFHPLEDGKALRTGTAERRLLLSAASA